MNKYYIQQLINEQFNIGNMDFNNKPNKNINIFNKNEYIPSLIYKCMLNNENVNISEI